ncbi:cytochrome C, partial [Escherichia coli]|nr:cytochrome C [Escherichia coli]EFW9361264.1 cytochrome C [Shigella sonnei]EEU1873896.1 cytochrome C [Escherichia coli]EFD5381687.1 cytochrome C [Escherichia coli]EFF1475609.1 cytochrome C [Escherichia coli]
MRGKKRIGLLFLLIAVVVGGGGLLLAQKALHKTSDTA